MGVQVELPGAWGGTKSQLAKPAGLAGEVSCEVGNTVLEESKRQFERSSKVREFGLTVKIYCRMVNKLSGGDWIGLEMVQRLVCAFGGECAKYHSSCISCRNLRVRLVPMLGAPGIVGLWFG